MPTSTPPKLLAANIPSITTLRNDLDYGHLGLPRCAAFCDDTRAFRKKFVTSDGVPGSDLHDWKSCEGQDGLTEMTVAYLDKEGNGAMFWPDDKASSKYNKYQYSKDHERIKRLVKQLFFRLNQQQFRNKKYKLKNNSEIKPADTRGLSEQSPIDVDAITTDPGQSSGTALVNEAPPHEPHTSPDRGDQNGTDIYAVPPSPPRMRQFETASPARVKRGPPIAYSPARGRQCKRRRQLRHSAQDNEQSTTDSTDQPRTSARTKRAVRRDGFHGLDVMNEVIDSAEVVDSAEVLDSTEVIDSAQGSDPGLETPNLAQQVSSPPSPVITVKPPLVDNITTSIDDSVRPWHVFDDDDLELSRILRPAPSPSQTPGHDSSHPDQDQDHPEVAHAAPSTSPHTPHSGSFQGLGRESEQPKPPLLHPSTSTTPVPAGGPGNGATSAVKFNYRVVLSRTPRTVTERWIPQGRFQEKTLAGLLKELPFDGGECQGLIFTIESSCMRTVERIPSDDEDGFESMKRYINMEIREWLVRQRSYGSYLAPRLVVDIMIERMSDEKKEGLDGMEDMELEW